MRGVRYDLAHNVADLGQFVHKVDAVVQAASGVDDGDVGSTGHGRLDRVKGHGGGVRAHILSDDVYAGPVGPDLDLVDGGRAECIRSAQDHFLPLGLEHRGELADGGGLAHAVHSHDHYHIRLLRKIKGDHLGGTVQVDELGYLLAKHAYELVEGHILVLLHALLERINDLERGVHAHIGGDERLLYGIEHIVVDA